MQILIPTHLIQPYQDNGLYLLLHHLTDVGKDLEEYQLTLPQHDWASTLHTNPLIAEESQYNLDQEQLSGEQRESQLNPNQQIAYATIINRIATEPTKAQFFLQGPARTGKTFLYKCICNYFRGRGKVVICIASSSIAALLLPSGRTAHSRFHIPLAVTDNSIFFLFFFFFIVT